jgi:hypothetical protein
MSPDPKSAREHQAGANLVVTQFLEHATFGTVGYVWPIHWTMHADAANRDIAAFRTLHSRLVEFPANAGNTRLIFDHDYLFEIYDLGVRSVIGAVLAVQHLIAQIEDRTAVNIGTGPVLERLSRACQGAGLDARRNAAAYSRFAELVKTRDRIEHPTPRTLLSDPTSNTWDEVPLAWMLSERGLACLESFRDWFDALVQDWKATPFMASNQNVTWTVERGMTSSRQLKKPPK